MEGIMMRSGDQYSIGVRKPDGEIEVKVEERPPRQATDIRCHPSLAMTSGFL